MEKIEEFFAANLTALRKEYGYTQAGLAEKLNYSDKAVSKWERAEAIPDVVVLKQIAELFNVTVDFLITEHDGQAIIKKEKAFNKKGFILSFAEILVWLAVIVIYALSRIIIGEGNGYYSRLWLLFIYGIVATFIVSTVFFSIWKKNICNCVSVSGLVWSIALAVHLTLNDPNMWLVFILAIPVQVLVIVWFVFRKIIKLRNERKKEL